MQLHGKESGYVEEGRIVHNTLIYQKQKGSSFQSAIKTFKKKSKKEDTSKSYMSLIAYSSSFRIFRFKLHVDNIVCYHIYKREWINFVFIILYLPENIYSTLTG